MSRASERYHDDLPLLRWSPPPKIVPFPACRRADFVLRNAQRMTDLPHEKALNHLDRTLGMMADRLSRLGVERKVIEADITAAKVAVLGRYAALGGGRP